MREEMMFLCDKILIYYYWSESMEGMVRIIKDSANYPKSKDTDGPIHPGY